MAQAGLTEAQVREIVRAELRNADVNVLIRQLQGRLLAGTGSPENIVTAPVGTLYTSDAGGAATTLYVKESGTGNTGWIAK